MIDVVTSTRDRYTRRGVRRLFVIVSVDYEFRYPSAVRRRRRRLPRRFCRSVGLTGARRTGTRNERRDELVVSRGARHRRRRPVRAVFPVLVDECRMSPRSRTVLDVRVGPLNRSFRARLGKPRGPDARNRDGRFVSPRLTFGNVAGFTCARTRGTTRRRLVSFEQFAERSPTLFSQCSRSFPSSTLTHPPPNLVGRFRTNKVLRFVFVTDEL